MRPTNKQLVRLALSHWASTWNESQEAQLALAFFARNLLNRTCLDDKVCCQRMLSLASGPMPTLDMEDKVQLQGMGNSLKLLRLAFAGELADPTGGAIRAHRHDECPAWADRAWPTSLIGPWIFYRAPEGAGRF
jgi:hypothetical protein